MSADTAGDRVAVVIGSTRPTRICPEIVEWTQRTLGEHSPSTGSLTAMKGLLMMTVTVGLLAGGTPALAQFVTARLTGNP